MAFCADWPTTNNDDEKRDGGSGGQKSGDHSEKSGNGAANPAWTDACAVLLSDARVMLFVPPSAIGGGVNGGGGGANANGVEGEGEAAAAAAAAASVYAEPACVGVIDLAYVFVLHSRIIS